VSANGEGSTNSTKGKDEEEEEEPFDLSFDDEFLFFDLQRAELEHEETAGHKEHF